MKQSLSDVLRAMKTMPEATPRETFRTNARIRILNTLTLPVAPTHAWQGIRVPYHVARWAGGLALASVVVGGTVVYAAQYSKPGSPLYPVKRASEQVALSVSPTQGIKTSVAAAVIDRRAEEVGQLKISGSPVDITRAVTEYQDTVTQLEHTSGLNMSQVTAHIREHQDIVSPQNGREKHSDEGTKRHNTTQSEGDKPAENHSDVPTVPVPSPEPGILNAFSEPTPTESTVQGAEIERQLQDQQDAHHAGD